MGCVEPQDQLGNCFECGMKLIPADEHGLQRGSTRMIDYADKRGLSNTRIDADKVISENQRNNNPRKSAYDIISAYIRMSIRINPLQRIFLKNFGSL
jgi:hypothetical protein